MVLYLCYQYFGRSSNGPPATPEQAHSCDGGRVAHILFMYYTYVLKSLKDEKLYIGWTDDLKNRFSFHCDGKVESTKNRRPLELIYYEACSNKKNAISREKYFKTGFGRKFLKNRI
jgi:putative endonuclease